MSDTNTDSDSEVEVKDNEQYDTMEHKEHILNLPDTYIGGIEPAVCENVWTCNSENDFINKDIEVSMGFYNIFNEILTNSADQCPRTREYAKKDKTVQITTTIKVTVDEETGIITVYNDGDGVPVTIHEKKKIYVPELIFGQLLSSSNYDKTKNKTWGGKHGYGSKLCLKKGTLLPTYNGTVSKIEDIQIGDELIGDDGNSRKVLNKVEGTGKLFEISQCKSASYVVNENHIICLRMPDHKVIFWNKTKTAWCMVWLDKENIKILSKHIIAGNAIKITCPECKIELHSYLKRHYTKMHKGITVPKMKRRSPTIIPPDTKEVKNALIEMQEFAKSISDDNTLDINIKDYLKLNKTMCSRLSGYVGECVQWDEKKVDLDPYVLGLWLGDGSRTGYCFAINSKDDPEILEYLEKWGVENDASFKQNKTNPIAFSISSLSRCGKAPLKKLLSKYNLVKNKHIPQDYIVNSKEIRLKVLAGLIDSDGCVQRDGTRITITQGMNHKKLAEDIIFLTKSLGFMCCSQNKKTQWSHKGELKKGNAININISGNGIEDIPTLVLRKKCASPIKHNTLNTGSIKIKEVEPGDYIGLSVNENQRFVLEDFTVTHNCNIYSTSFEVETVDHRRGKKFKQIWRDNMSDPEKKAKITKCSGKAYTKITFLPEYSRFGMPDGLKGDIVDLIRKRTYDIAGCTPRDVSVYFNGEKLSVKDFPMYVEMYIGKQKDVKRVYEKPNDNWEITACASPDGTFKQVSMVNGICTINGGKHVDYIANQICKNLVAKINGKSKNGIKTAHVKNNLWVFINSLIVNPSFSTQTKEALTTPAAKFGSKCDLSEDFIKRLAKTELADRAKLMKSFHDKSGLTKTDGKKTKSIRGIPKLDDANWAGTNKSQECTLILTEGDSAKTLVISGLSVVGRDKYGVFPLKGKLLNIRDATTKKISENEEIQNLKKILGLQQNTKSVKDLRYGKVMIMTDQDLDGYHIKGLLMNMFSCSWEGLLKEGFLVTMYTPLVKVFKGTKCIKSFYNQKNYEQWKNTQLSLKGFHIKYYKGLGTSTKNEAQEYFKNMNIVGYTWCENSAEMIDLAFNKKKADKRKKWLSFFDKDDVINPLDKSITCETFINKDLIHFSNYDNYRSIPSMCDGFKPSQRKAMHTFIKKNIVNEMKVAQVTGYVTAETSYHHGETSMEGTIIGLAQNYVGSNNINILTPKGGFGTRLQGGNDHASSRYIFTKLEKIGKLLFRKEDEALLNILIEEGTEIEPEWFMPILPMVLVNGAHGIGTGFSTHVPCFNPKDLIFNLRMMMENKQIKSLVPWYRPFKGKVVKKTVKGKKQWFTEGTFNFKNATTLVITELPIGIWTDAYHQHLESLIIDNSEKDAKKKKKHCIIGFKKCNDHDDENVHLEVTLKKEKLSDFKENLSLLKKTFKLEESKSCSVTNLHMFDPLGEIVKFNSPESILRSYYRIRLPFYKKRREFQIKFLQREIRFLTSKIRFVKGMIEETIHISKRPNGDILIELRDTHGFPPDPSKDEIVIYPVKKEVYVKALDGEVKRYSYNNDGSDDSSDEDSEIDSDDEVKTDDDEDDIKDLSELTDMTHPNGQSPYSTEDDASVASKQDQEEQERKIEDVRPVKEILTDDYGYLLKMPIWTMTEEKLKELENLNYKKKKELDYMEKITPKELWKLDLEELEKEM